MHPIQELMKKKLVFGAWSVFEEELLDGSGKLRLDYACLAAFAHGEYFELGKKLGSFGFSVRKKKPHKKTNRK